MCYPNPHAQTLFRLIFLLALLLTCALPVSNVQAQSRADVHVNLQSVKDIIVVSEASGVVVYVTDPLSGSIFYSRRPAQDVGKLDFADFKLFLRTAPLYPQPSGIAYWRGRLVVCDKIANAVFEVELGNEFEISLKPLALKNLINAPEHIAISEQGMLAVASDTQIQYFASEKEDPVSVVTSIPDIDRLTYDGDHLLVLDEHGTGNLYSFAPGQWSGHGGNKALSATMRDQLPSIQDFAVFRGVYYVAGHVDIIAFGQSNLKRGVEPSLITIPLPIDPDRNISKIAASASSIYVADAARKTILVVKRPVPIVVDFPRVETAGFAEQAEILQLLEKQEALLKRPIISQKPYQSVSDFVREELFPAGENSSQPDEGTISSRALLVCRLNDWKCFQRTDRGGTEVVKEGGGIGIRNEVNITASKVRGYTAFQTGSENPEFKDLETYLTELSVIPFTRQINSVSPGQLVAISAEDQGNPRNVGKCATEAVEVVPTSFPNQIEVTPEAFINQIGAKISSAQLEKLGVAKIVASYVDPTYSRLKLSVTEKYKLCFQGDPATSPDNYLVDRVLTVAAAQYRFFDRKGKVLTLERTTPFGAPSFFPNESQEWIWKGEERPKLGYVAVRFSTFDAAQGLSIRTEHFRPKRRTEKVQAQQFTLLVDADQVLSVLSTINDFAQKKGLPFYASSAQDQSFRGLEQSIVPENSLPLIAPRPPLTLDDAIAERRRVAGLIHFPQSLSTLELGNLKVGVVENLSSIDDQHQCFFDDEGRWTWGETQADDVSDPAVPAATATRTPGRVKNPEEFNLVTEPEHGTHVAAIIAAKSVLPGLLPTLRLVKIDASNLSDEIPANIRDVQIFNVSTAPPGDLVNHQGLINQIKDGQLNHGDVLLIAAAGNQGQDYAQGEPPPPAGWLRQIPDNLLVVGASTSSTPLTRLPSVTISDQVLPGSNYSKKYVQLLAPGENIFSAAKGNTYAPASGTSQAVPQVTAVAAFLRSKALSATWIKAVLIYTADWREDLMEQVWGGTLNAERAEQSTLPRPNSLWFKNEPQSKSVVPIQNKYNIRVLSAKVNDPSTKESLFINLTSANSAIPFDDILRVQQMNPPNGGLFRVIYLDKDGYLRMLVNAQLQGGIRCRVQRSADGQKLPDDPCGDYAEGNEPQGLIPFTKLTDYLRAVPFGTSYRQVKFAAP